MLCVTCIGSPPPLHSSQGESCCHTKHESVWLCLNTGFIRDSFYSYFRGWTSKSGIYSTSSVVTMLVPILSYEHMFHTPTRIGVRRVCVIPGSKGTSLSSKIKWSFIVGSVDMTVCFCTFFCLYQEIRITCDVTTKLSIYRYLERLKI